MNEKKQVFNMYKTQKAKEEKVRTYIKALKALKFKSSHNLTEM